MIPEKQNLKSKIEQNLLKILFFRRDLIEVLKPFLGDNILFDKLPKIYQKPDFLNYLTKNEIAITSNLEPKEEEESSNPNEEKIKRIIREDNLEEFQKETEQAFNLNVTETFFEDENMNIPILDYCVIKKALKCFKFFILIGADPTVKLSQIQSTIQPKQQASNQRSRFGHFSFRRKQNQPNVQPKQHYEWDCISIAICFGEWEMVKILEERGIKKQNNTKVWEAAALTHRNNLLKLFISNKEEIDNSLFEECLQKGLEGAIKGNNLKERIILISAGADINAKDIIYQNIKLIIFNHSKTN